MHFAGQLVGLGCQGRGRGLRIWDLRLRLQVLSKAPQSVNVPLHRCAFFDLDLNAWSDVGTQLLPSMEAPGTNELGLRCLGFEFWVKGFGF